MTDPTLNVALFLDFDGTITNVDALERVLDRFADPEWRTLDSPLPALSDRDRFARQLKLLQVSTADVLALLKREIRLRSGFERLVDWAEREKYTLHVVSGGIRWILDDLLRGLSHRMRIDANDAVVNSRGEWTLVSHSGRRVCEECSHCKTAHIFDARRSSSGKLLTVYVGDGHTDRCPVHFVDIRFARGTLAKYCEENRLSYYPFESFFDVQKLLVKLIERERIELRKEAWVRAELRYALRREREARYFRWYWSARFRKAREMLQKVAPSRTDPEWTRAYRSSIESRSANSV